MLKRGITKTQQIGKRVLNSQTKRNRVESHVVAHRNVMANTNTLEIEEPSSEVEATNENVDAPEPLQHELLTSESYLFPPNEQVKKIKSAGTHDSFETTRPQTRKAQTGEG